MFTLPPLPYPETALAPAISSATLTTHHGKHHAGYVKKTNLLLKERAEISLGLEDVVRLAHREQAMTLFNNAAQSWNHAFLWQCMTPDYVAPAGDLGIALRDAFGDLATFQQEFVSRGVAHFASGWVWLVADRAGKLELRDLHDAQTPLTDSGVTALLVCDVWEHAYYLDYKNARESYLEAFIGGLANWRFAAAQYDAARGKARAWRFGDEGTGVSG